MTPSAPVGLPLGRSPRPNAGAELAERVRAALLTGTAGVRAVRLAPGAVTAVMSAADVTELALDLNGVQFEVDPAASEERGEAAEVIGEENAVLRACALDAHPLEVRGARIDLTVRLAELPIVWITRADGTLEVADRLGSAEGDARPPTGDARITVSHEALAILVTEAAGIATAAQPDVELGDVELAVTPAGPDAVAVEGGAQLRYKAVRARVQLSATARVVDGTRIRIDDVRVTSRNILAAALLGVLRGEIERATAEEIDLMSGLPAGIRDARVAIEADADGLTLSARIG